MQKSGDRNAIDVSVSFISHALPLELHSSWQKRRISRCVRLNRSKTANGSFFLAYPAMVLVL